ncbi:hypothetical protein L6452_26295 [Arctium lappa]|uniref:Uncharacterized protein n=1 Tax=Arctium lappa TaxID=4217 RepID=A0ACB9ACT0_ARCLA|nr:hypothetical protein L6452_26295 [Arctium lappa]
MQSLKDKVESLKGKVEDRLEKVDDSLILLQEDSKRKFNDEEDHNHQKGEKRQRTEPSVVYVQVGKQNSEKDQSTQKDGGDGVDEMVVDEAESVESNVNLYTNIVLYNFEVSE